MIKIKTDNSRGKEIVAELVQLIVTNGGYLHPHLQVEFSGVEMSLSHSKRLDAGEAVIVLPLHCMPVLSDFDFELENRTIVAMPRPDANSSALQRNLMALCTELYNLYDKVEAYASVCPSVALREHGELLAAILQTSNAETFAERRFNSLAELKIFCFWHNRAFHDLASRTDRLIPFLEFADHNAFADGYRADYSNDAGATVNLNYAAVKKRAVYACYAAIDALACYVKYGFFDRSSFFVKSQPFSLELPEIGEVVVNRHDISASRMPEEQWLWPPKFNNSFFYTPTIQRIDSGRPEISYALIPPQRHFPAFDDSLVQQMAQLEKIGDLEAGALNNSQTTRLFKRALINENKQSLQKLVALAKAAKLDKNAPAALALMATLRHQAHLLREFEASAL